jgi:hypothetical protein
MDSDAPRLFEMAAVAPVTSSPRPGRGRRRETWVCKVSAHVAVVDSAALDAAMAQAEADGLLVAILQDENGEGTPDDHGDGTVAGLDRVGWLLWPTDGLDLVLEAGAFDVWEVATEVAAESDAEGTVTWSSTVRLRDVPALRRIAVAAHPQESRAINESVAAAWQCAIDPFAPIRSVPGIRWQPGPVEIQHVPARAGSGA